MLRRKLLILLLVSFLGFPLTSNKDIAASTNEPEPGQKNLLVFIHGIFGTAEETWQNFPDLVKKDTSLASEYAVAFYEYPSIYLCFRPLPALCTTDVETLADGLRTQINNRYREYEEIVLVVHSLGGIIAMKYLVDEVESNRGLKVGGIVLFAVPNSGSEVATLARKLVPWYMPLLEQLSLRSPFTQELSLKWVKLNMAGRVKAKYVFAGLDEVINKEFIKLLWDDVETVNKGHMEVVKPGDAQDDSFVILRNFLLDRKQSLRQLRRRCYAVSQESDYIRRALVPVTR